MVGLLGDRVLGLCGLDLRALLQVRLGGIGGLAEILAYLRGRLSRISFAHVTRVGVVIGGHRSLLPAAGRRLPPAVSARFPVRTPRCPARTPLNANPGGPVFAF